MRAIGGKADKAWQSHPSVTLSHRDEVERRENLVNCHPGVCSEPLALERPVPYEQPVPKSVANREAKGKHLEAEKRCHPGALPKKDEGYQGGVGQSF